MPEIHIGARRRTGFPARERPYLGSATRFDRYKRRIDHVDGWNEGGMEVLRIHPGLERIVIETFAGFLHGGT
jgi:hypothetical protein